LLSGLAAGARCPNSSNAVSIVARVRGSVSLGRVIPSKSVRRPFVVAVAFVIRDLSRGEVVSYGEVARRAGFPGAARAVGNVLANSVGLPWWRVVRATGEPVLKNREEQIRRLRREGVSIRGNRVTIQRTKSRKGGR
jgi:methylated-DNA-protein-cysteine methyltransferase-like protein